MSVSLPTTLVSLPAVPTNIDVSAIAGLTAGVGVSGLGDALPTGALGGLADATAALGGLTGATAALGGLTGALPTGALDTSSVPGLSTLVPILTSLVQALQGLPVVGSLPVVGELLTTLESLPEELASGDASGAVENVSGLLSGLTTELTGAAGSLTGLVSGLL